MMDKKGSDENLFNDNFDTDFDFGEEEAPPSDTEPTSKTVSRGARSKTKILILVGALFLAFTAYMGFTFLQKPSGTPPTALISKTSEPVAKPQTTPTTLPKAETTTITAPQALPSQTKPKPESALNEIAQAFSSADQAPPPKTSSSTVKEMQKELFTPSPSSQATGQTPSSTTPEVAATETKGASPAEAQQMADAMNAMLKLGQQMDYTINQIKQLDVYTRDISQTIAKLNTDISAMDNRILALTTTTSSLSKDLGHVKSEVGRYKPSNPIENFDRMDEEIVAVSSAPRKRPAAPGCPVPEDPEYTVHAAIPGRAWLKTSKGQIITVTEGETVGNYGKVLVIDAANGVVLTNSGITFR